MKTQKNETESKSFLDQLTETLTLVREALHKPDDEIEPGEQVVGTLEDERLRALFSLKTSLRGALLRFKSSLPDKQPADDDVRRLQMKGYALAEQYTIADKLFWEGVHSWFPVTRDPRVAVGIRKGWTVVIFKSSSDSPLDKLIKALFGL